MVLKHGKKDPRLRRAGATKTLVCAKIAFQSDFKSRALIGRFRPCSRSQTKKNPAKGRVFKASPSAIFAAKPHANHFKLFASVVPMSAGLREIEQPAAASASNFASAVSLPPVMIAPA